MSWNNKEEIYMCFCMYVKHELLNITRLEEISDRHCRENQKKKKPTTTTTTTLFIRLTDINIIKQELSPCV